MHTIFCSICRRAVFPGEPLPESRENVYVASVVYCQHCNRWLVCCIMPPSDQAQGDLSIIIPIDSEPIDQLAADHDGAAFCKKIESILLSYLPQRGVGPETTFEIFLNCPSAAPLPRARSARPITHSELNAFRRCLERDKLTYSQLSRA